MVYYYENLDGGFGLSFPMGIDAKKLVMKLEKDTEALAGMAFDDLPTEDGWDGIQSQV